MSEVHIRLEERNIPLDASGNVLLDLYILMPSSRRYIPFVKKGCAFSPEKKEKLNKHVLPNIFVLPSELDAAVEAAVNKNDIDLPAVGEFNAEVLGKQAEGELKAIYKDLLDGGEQDPQVLISALQNSSDKILSLVAPESKELTKIFFSNARYINLMNDASAIVSLAVMFAFANGFDSKKSYTELTQAALVMDVSLSTMGEDHRKLMYTDQEKLPEEIKKAIHGHPQKSFALVSEKLPNLSEITMQLILNHHELFNGKGFPRGIRTESLFPLVKILALAVDVHDMLVCAQYNKESVDLAELMFNVHNDDVEAHLRRHHRSVTQKILDFFDSNQGEEAA